MEQIVVDTLKEIGSGNVSGAMFVLLLVLFGYREIRHWPNQISKLEGEIARSHEAHDMTRKSLLEEVRAGGETLVLVRDQMKAQEGAMNAVLKWVTEQRNTPVRRRR